MAELVLTDEEKETASYLEWDDEALGRFTKYMALMWAQMPRDAKAFNRVLGASCAIAIMDVCAACNATDFEARIEGLMHGDKPLGDWVLTLRRVGPRPWWWWVRAIWNGGKHRFVQRWQA